MANRIVVVVVVVVVVVALDRNRQRFQFIVVVTDNGKILVQGMKDKGHGTSCTGISFLLLFRLCQRR